MAGTSSQSSDRSSSKRGASSSAGGDKASRPVKRRASKACQCCRARKVRCNVVEHGAPCTNCRLDEVECIVTESKRKRRKSLARIEEGRSRDFHEETVPFRDGERIQPHGILEGIPNLCQLQQDQSASEHVPHPLYRSHTDQPLGSHAFHRASMTSWNSVPATMFNTHALFHENQRPFLAGMASSNPSKESLPENLKSLPLKMGAEEVAYLEKKNVFAIPQQSLRNEIMRCYVEFVHPFMPILDLNDFFQTLDQADGRAGKISLLLYHAVIFAGSAFVDITHLKRAGHPSRKEARRDFFQKARLLYDFDCEQDRLTVVQALLLMTYWYGSPDDQKDTWHWMGLAISWSQSIGLHRDPAKSTMPYQRQRQWKRTWWSCLMRDRVVALGMRRPTRIKEEDCDVPMLTLDDFQLEALPLEVSCIPNDCLAARDVDVQETLAAMCIEKAKLCMCISNVLTTVYSVPDCRTGMLSEEGNFRATTTLAPRNPVHIVTGVRACHEQLQDWLHNLPEDVELETPSPDEVTRLDAPVVLNRTFLHMLYFTTLSALHRPQVSIAAQRARREALPEDSGIESDEASEDDPQDDESTQISKQSCALVASEITKLGHNLLELGFVRFLPSTGVTVMSPAIIQHLFDMRSSDPELRRSGLAGFCSCIRVMARLRDSYASADFTMAFLEASVRKAGIEIPNPSGDGTVRATSSEDLVNAGLRQNLVSPLQQVSASPSYSESEYTSLDDNEDDVTTKLEMFLDSTPPASNYDFRREGDGLVTPGLSGMPDLDREFECLINMDGSAGEVTFMDDNQNGLASVPGESGGIAVDVGWMISSSKDDQRLAQPGVFDDITMGDLPEIATIS